jgi:hypothetical protein
MTHHVLWSFLFRGVSTYLVGARSEVVRRITHLYLENVENQARQCRVRVLQYGRMPVLCWRRIRDEYENRAYVMRVQFAHLAGTSSLTNIRLYWPRVPQ